MWSFRLSFSRGKTIILLKHKKLNILIFVKRRLKPLGLCIIVMYTFLLIIKQGYIKKTTMVEPLEDMKLTLMTKLTSSAKCLQEGINVLAQSSPRPIEDCPDKDFHPDYRGKLVKTNTTTNASLSLLNPTIKGQETSFHFGTWSGVVISILMRCHSIITSTNTPR